jgi:hypothetical protein
MRNSESTLALKFQKQELIKSEDREEIISFLSREDGQTAEHHVIHKFQSPFIECFTVYKNDSEKELTLEMLSSFSLGSITPFVMDNPADSIELYRMRSQWSAEAKHKLTSQKRAPTVFNQILPVVDMIVGHQIQNRVDLVAKPVDKDGDVILADILTSTIKNIEWQNNSTFERRFQFLDGVATGVGVKEIWLEPDDELQPLIRVEQKSPWHYYLDPKVEKYDYRDGHRLYKEAWMSPHEVLLNFGAKVAQQLSFPTQYGEEYPAHMVPATWDRNPSDYGNRRDSSDEYDEDEWIRRGFDIKNRLVRVIEEYEKIYERVEMIYDPTTNKGVRLDTLSPMEQELLRSEAIPVVSSYIMLTTLVGDSVIAQERPIRSKKGRNVEFYHLFNLYFPYWMNGKYWGIIENLMYPQEDINKHYSQIIHILNSFANSGLFYETDAMSETVKAELEEKLATNGVAIELEEGGLGKIREIQRHEPPQALFNLTASKTELTKYIASVPDSFQGIAKRAQSGRAKEAEVNQASVKLLGVIENFRETQRLEGKACLWWIQNFYTSKRLIRVLGTGNDRDMQEVELNKVAFGQIFNDVSIGRYDITLEFEGKTQSERERNKFMLIELSNTVPQYADIIAEEVLELSDSPRKERILQKWQERQQMIQQQALAQAGGGGGSPFGQPATGPIQSAPRPGSGPRRMPAGM